MNNDTVLTIQLAYPAYVSEYTGVVLDGVNTPVNYEYGIKIENSSDITLIGITLKNFNRNGINVSRSSYINCVGCESYNTIGVNIDSTTSCAGIFFELSDTCTIENCSIYQGTPSTPLTYFDQNEGIYIQGCSTMVIRNNYIFLNSQVPTLNDENPHIDGIQVTWMATGATYSYNVQIEKNYIINVGRMIQPDNWLRRSGIGIAKAAGQILIANNNIVVPYGKDLINLHFESNNSSIKIFNNTLVSTDNPTYLVEIVKETGGDPEILNIKNNIFYKAGALVNSDLDAIFFDNIDSTQISLLNLNHNLYYNNNTPQGNKVKLIFENGNKNWDYNGPVGSDENPQFVLTATQDYKYYTLYESPAKNLGIFLPDVTKDILDNPRPYWGDDYDAGAYEIEDTQLKIGVRRDNQLNVTHTLTAFGTYWEQNTAGNFPVSNDESLAAQSFQTGEVLSSDEVMHLWKYPGIEYKWMDRGNSVDETIGAGLYMLKNNVFDDTLFIDLRDAISDYSLNLYILLDLQTDPDNPVYKFYNGTNFVAANSGDIIRIWDVNKHQITSTTSGLQDYWENALVPLSKSINNVNHPLLAWGPYPDAAILNGTLTQFRVYRSYYHVPGTTPIGFPLFRTLETDSFSYYDNTINLGDDYNAIDYKVSGWVEFESEGNGEYFTNILEYLVETPNKYSAENPEKISRFALDQNYPNPFNPITELSFSLPSSEYVTLKVYDILGRELSILVNEKLDAGVHNISFNAQNLSSGIYFYSLNAGHYYSVKKMQLLK